MEVQTRNSDFAVLDRESPGPFFTVTSEVGAHLYVFLGLNLCVHYDGAQKKLLREVVIMEEAEVLPAPVFVGHGYVQQAGHEWRSEHCIWYLIYLNLEIGDLQDAVAFDYEESTALWSRMPPYLKKEVWTTRRVISMEIH